MVPAAIELAAAFEGSPRAHLVIVGAGGKSSLMVALSREQRRAGVRVLSTTTTKVWLRQALEVGDLVLSDEDGWRSRLERALFIRKGVFLGRRRLPTGKVEGIRPELADTLFRSQGIDSLLVEGDGAAGRPLKAPRAGEPVVPSTATRVVAVMGLEALGKPLEHEVVHRMERFTAVTGASPGTILTAPVLVRVFSSPAGLFQGTPDGARRTVFLNQLDRVPKPEDACELARAVLESPEARVREVIIGSVHQERYLRLTRT